MTPAGAATAGWSPEGGPGIDLRRRRGRRSIAGRPRAEVGGGSGHDPLLQALRRFDHRNACREHRQNATQLGHLGMRLRTGGEVGPNGGIIRGVKGAENEGPGHLPDRLARHAARRVRRPQITRTAAPPGTVGMRGSVM